VKQLLSSSFLHHIRSSLDATKIVGGTVDGALILNDFKLEKSQDLKQFFFISESKIT